MRVLICGGREFTDARWLTDFLHARHHVTPFSCVIHGAAPGADTLAAQWATTQGISVQPYPAQWEKFGRSAGSIRNQQMLREGKPDLVIAFPGGRGTQDMMDRATKAGITVIRAMAHRYEKT